VRHHLVQRIIRAYDEHKTRIAEQQLSLLENKGSANGKGNGMDLPLEGDSVPPKTLEIES
jgi:hypothetical protein